MGLVQSEKDKPQKSLFGSRPIEPVDTRAADIGVRDIEGFVKDRDRQFFRDFASFADWFNRPFIKFGDTLGTWRLQELEDTKLTGPERNTPSYGCRYSVYYDQVCLGLLQLSADDFEYTTDNPLVWVDLELERVRMLPFDHVQVFLLRLMRSLIAPRPDYPPAQEMIHNAILKLLWPYKSQYEEDADLELGYGGSAAHFLASRIIAGMPESGMAK